MNIILWNLCYIILTDETNDEEYYKRIEERK